MTETIFNHDRLDVYWLAVEYTAESFRLASGLSGLHRHARDQWLRAPQVHPAERAIVDYEHEHRFAEQEHGEESEPTDVVTS